MAKDIVIKGANENNLKNIDVTIPRDRFVVLTGLSGSGKSSLAFDTIYAEGQRRYMESLSSYARQFLGQMEKPDVEYIEGLSGDLYRSEDHQPQPQIHRGNGDRDPRLPQTIICQDRKTALPYMRKAYNQPVGRPDCRYNNGLSGRD